ncbi:hypothetical protein [Tunturiibacter gelidiferens]|uniref:hypothetical protein n=1 Tax=Tunturiibacter gelidiferens TaxID=3069689 RepID=UPI003D9B1DCF
MMEERERWPAWLYVSVTAGAILMALGGVIALVKPGLLLGPGDAISPGVRVYAGYLVSRNLALAAMLLVLLFLRAGRMLQGMMLLTAAIQVLDAVLDVIEGRRPIVPGVLVFGVVFLLGARWLGRRVSR